MQSILFDTSVLVAASITIHSQHTAAIGWMEKVITKKITLIVAAHSIAEIYSVFSRLPITPRVTPQEAQHLISENILKHAKIVSLTEQDYWETIEMLSNLDLGGGVTYDALLFKAAKNAKADKILTFNAKDFIRWCPKMPDYIIIP